MRNHSWIVYTVEVYLDLINEFDFSNLTSNDLFRPLKAIFVEITTSTVNAFCRVRSRTRQKPFFGGREREKER